MEFDLIPYTYYGRISSEVEAENIIEKCKDGELNLIKERLHDGHKRQIKAGYVFVYDSNSAIKRWTDGKLWTPSKVVGRFLCYHELHRRYSPYNVVTDPRTKKRQLKLHPNDTNDLKLFGQKIKLAANDPKTELKVLKTELRLKGLFIYKKFGMIKKTYKTKLKDGTIYHLVAYEHSEGNESLNDFKLKMDN